MKQKRAYRLKIKLEDVAVEQFMRECCDNGLTLEQATAKFDAEWTANPDKFFIVFEEKPPVQPC